MQFQLGENTWALDEMNAVEWALLEELPSAADIGRSEKGRKRILPDPSSEDQKEVVADWREFVVPELETEFTRSVDAVAGQISSATESEDEDGNPLHRLEVPNEEAETWYRVLNQARLIMNEDHDVIGMERRLFSGEVEPDDVGVEFGRLIVQNHLYARIQEALLTTFMES